MDQPYIDRPFVTPTKAVPGKQSVCRNCGNEFTQQADGITAGNLCAYCWELRRLRSKFLLQRWDRRQRKAAIGSWVIGILFVAWLLWMAYAAMYR